MQGKDRLIFPLDVPTVDAALALVDDLEGLISFYKVGLELLMSGGMRELLAHLAQDKQVFVDLKLPADIGETIRRATALTSEWGVRFLTLSSSATEATIAAAREGRGRAARPELLFVPQLSSEAAFDADHARRAAWALAAGCDGLIASGDAIGLLRRQHPEAVIVSPGIRPRGSSTDDHKRCTTPSEAIRMGADYLVVGRPIRDCPGREARRERARSVIEEIDAALNEKASSRR